MQTLDCTLNKFKHIVFLQQIYPALCVYVFLVPLLRSFCVAVYFNVENNLISSLQPPPVCRAAAFSLRALCLPCSEWIFLPGLSMMWLCENRTAKCTHTQPSLRLEECRRALKSITSTPTARLFAGIIILTKKSKETHTKRETLWAWVMRPRHPPIRFKYSSNRLRARADMETSH